MSKARRADGTALVLAALLGACHGGGRSSPEPGAVDRPGPSVVARRDTLQDVALSMDELIRRRVPGVDVRGSGSSLQIRVRGTAGLTGTGEPLIVVDGVTLQSVSALSGVNPADVDRIELLKDAAASIYGVRGTNGVLVITTRRR